MFYDVLKEPWIPVVTGSGEIRYVGIREAISNAHRFSAIRGENPLVTYGIHRLLIAFLQDALRPEDSYALEDIIIAKRFKDENLENYYVACQKDGECFDLLDDRYPFLQTAFPSNEEIGPSPISALFFQWPSGNNHIHFNHQLESKMCAEPAECLRALCTLSAFQLSFSRSKHCSVNGTPPKYFLYAGENLFVTLACSMVGKSQMDNVSYDIPPPAWRDKAPVPNRQAPAVVSLLHGLTARPLRIQLCPSDNGKICSAKLSYGFDYKEIQNWTDPHVAYYFHKEKGRLPLPCREGREVWRDMGTVLRREGRPMFMQHASRLLECLPGQKTFMAFRVYGLSSEQKTALLMPVGWEEEDLPLHKSLLSVPEQVDFLQTCLECMEDVNSRLAWVMGRSMHQMQGQGSGKRDAKGSYRFLIPQVQTLYLSSVRLYLLDTFIPFIEAQTELYQDWDAKCRVVWGTQIRTFAQSAYQQTLSRMAQTATLLKWRAVAGNLLNASLINILKKGGFTKND